MVSPIVPRGKDSALQGAWVVGCLTGPQGFTLGCDVRPRWGRAVYRNGKKGESGRKRMA